MKKRTIQIALYIMLCVVFLLAMAGTVMADEPELDSNPTNAVDINTQGELLAVLNDTGTKTGTYRLQSDLTIDTSTLRQEAEQQDQGKHHYPEGPVHSPGKYRKEGILGCLPPVVHIQAVMFFNHLIHLLPCHPSDPRTVPGPRHALIRRGKDPPPSG